MHTRTAAGVPNCGWTSLDGPSLHTSVDYTYYTCSPMSVSPPAAAHLLLQLLVALAQFPGGFAPVPPHALLVLHPQLLVLLLVRAQLELVLIVLEFGGKGVLGIK